jgi:hypothetical protein
MFFLPYIRNRNYRFQRLFSALGAFSCGNIPAHELVYKKAKKRHAYT